MGPDGPQFEPSYVRHAREGSATTQHFMVDLEECFRPSAVAPYRPFEEWGHLELKTVQFNTAPLPHAPPGDPPRHEIMSHRFKHGLMLRAARADGVAIATGPERKSHGTGWLLDSCPPSQHRLDFSSNRSAAKSSPRSGPLQVTSDASDLSQVGPSDFVHMGGALGARPSVSEGVRKRFVHHRPVISLEKSGLTSGGDLCSASCFLNPALQ